jgi:hypothetical protein
MGQRNWSGQRVRDRVRGHGFESARDLPSIFAPLDGIRPDRSQSKLSKQQLREQATAAIASFGGNVQRLERKLNLHCKSCGHRGTATIPPGQQWKFRCSKCGSRL